jgi:hypothetical protein
METLTTPKTNYLLEAGLDVLHHESQEWLGELEFFKSELRFFGKLLNSKVFALEKDQQRQHIYTNMNKLSDSVLTELLLEVKSHEKSLAAVLLAKKDTDDAHYRAKHKELYQKVQQLKNDVRTLKMLVFVFVENLK